jgi:hypothetical protein
MRFSASRQPPLASTLPCASGIGVAGPGIAEGCVPGGQGSYPFGSLCPGTWEIDAPLLYDREGCDPAGLVATCERQPPTLDLAPGQTGVVGVQCSVGDAGVPPDAGMDPDGGTDGGPAPDGGPTDGGAPDGGVVTNYSMRFFGNGMNDIDRVKVLIDGPVNVGVGDFTLELWLKALPGENGAETCAPGLDNWIFGNIVLDRDVFGAGDYGDFGVSIFQSGIAFGVARGSSGDGLCGTLNIADGSWHHVAVTRRAGDGRLQLFVDGVLDGEAQGPTGDVSYRVGRSTSFPNDPFLVIGAEKHDAGPLYPSFSGWIDELRFSTSLRYSGNFQPPTGPFGTDASTVLLYHFDEGSGTVVLDTSGAVGGPSHGTVQFGGSPAGPVWSSDTPF